MKKICLIFLGSVFGASPLYAATPASQEYVACQIQTLKNLLQGQITNACGCTTPTSYTIGQQIGGGIVFWVSHSGREALVAATTDAGQSTWLGATDFKGAPAIAGLVADGIFAGSANTKSAVSQALTESITMCAASNVGGYTDWYLPSKTELSLLYQQSLTPQNVPAGVPVLSNFNGNLYYWSSTEDTDPSGLLATATDTQAIYAWAQQFPPTPLAPGAEPFGLSIPLAKTQQGAVRCIRAISTSCCNG